MTRLTRDEKRRAGRAEADEADALMERLLDLDAAGLRQIPLEPQLAEDLWRVRSQRRDGGWRREVRRLTGELRDADRAPILEAVRRVEAGRSAATADFHQWERWRERLLTEGEQGLEALRQTWPHVDAAELTRLVDEARTAGGRGPAYRELFRRLRALGG